MKLYVPIAFCLLLLFPLNIVAQEKREFSFDGPSDEERKKLPEFKPLTVEQQNALLDKRHRGGMEGSFADFGKMFVITSAVELGQIVGLVTSSRKIIQTDLRPVFPESYHPTLRETLDAIALQTHSTWEYDPTDKYLENSGPTNSVTLFAFTETKREKPFKVTLAEGWTREDKGNWVMHIPPVFPVGMDIYEMGTYSSSELDDKELQGKVRESVAMQWAQNVNQEATKSDLQRAKVGDFDALFYETVIPARSGSPVRWRHWVLMDGNKCYFVVSTIFPEFEERLYPDVQKMLASFELK